MAYNHHPRVSCPLCGHGEMGMVHPFLARCTECKDTISYNFFNTLRQIRKLPDAKGEHPCKCGHPETRRLPDGVYRCPSCGSEVVYLTRANSQPKHRDRRTER